jgi:predicted aspartyl protease
MSGVIYPLLLLTLPIEAPGGMPPAPPQDPELISPESVMEATLLTLGEIDQRLTVPVAVNARGPYNFIIDTGAERTVVSRELANTLRLSAGNPVTLLSMTGRSQVDTVLVPDLMIKSVGILHSVVAPKLEARNLGAIGLLGIDTLRDHQVSIDFERGTMEVRKSEKRPKFQRKANDEIVVTAKSVFGQLIVTDAYYGNTRIQVVLDTGSQVSMGNSALRKRIARSRKTQPIELTDVTGDKAMADYTTVAGIKIGEVVFGSMPVAFADVAPFERFGLMKRPALLLGMDALRSFRRVDIDFPNRQVRFLMPKNTRTQLQEYRSPTTGAGGYSSNKTL